MKLKEGDPAGSIADLTLCIEGKIKLVLNGVVNLSEKMRGSFDPETFQIDFNPSDKNQFCFSTKFGLFYSKINVTRGEVFSSPTVRKLDISTIGTEVIVTSISFSDQGFILVGFDEGSIGLYHSDYSSPLSVWYNACNC